MIRNQHEDMMKDCETPTDDREDFSWIDTAADYPEDFLWINMAGGGLTATNPDRLIDLLDGAEPRTQHEELIMTNPHWLKFYLNHVNGEYVLTISEDQPLPKFDERYARSCVDEEQIEQLKQHGVIESLPGDRQKI
jgi:hypothetical protein